MNYQKPPLPVHISPETGEDFTSWLCRIAAGNGMTGSNFLRSMLGNKGISSAFSNIKATPNEKTIATLAQKTGVPVQSILKSSLLREMRGTNGAERSNIRSSLLEKLIKQFLHYRRPYCPPVFHGRHYFLPS